MLRSIIKIGVSAFIFILPQLATSASLVGEWCENGGPYVCYPPIDNKNSEYVCTDGTSISEATDETVVFVTRQTIHYYSNGFKNGKTSPQIVKSIYRKVETNGADRFEFVETRGDEKIQRDLTVKGNTLQIAFSRETNSADKPATVGKINYQRCSDDPKKKTFYTALIDCGGSGDYITGVPAVVNNPLNWDLGEEIKIDKSRCQVAAKCWGGGWVAFAKSKQDGEDSKEAFGAACGTENRNEAKQQAINSCRESGGTNCLAQVVSGYDDGSNELDDSTHKGEYVETCANGDCAIISAK